MDSKNKYIKNRKREETHWKGQGNTGTQSGVLRC